MTREVCWTEMDEVVMIRVDRKADVKKKEKDVGMGKTVLGIKARVEIRVAGDGANL